jgi:CBS domain-containing membrane protein
MPEQQHSPDWLDQLEHLEHAEAEVVRRLLDRLRLSRLLGRYPARWVWAAFMLVNGFLTIGLLAGLAALSGIPFIFPSLGPTAFLFFFLPLAASSSPRNALYGHAVGIVCGYVSLWMTGLQDAPNVLEEGVNLPRTLAAALSLASTGALMIVCRTPHPPAGATTLIVSLGLVREPFRLFIIEAAVALMTLQAVVINRLAGLDYPLWSSRRRPPRGTFRPDPPLE